MLPPDSAGYVLVGDLQAPLDLLLDVQRLIAIRKPGRRS